MAATTLHVDDPRAEIHKLVVGPMDNNVFVIRCKESGEAVLVDAANEHEKLLELCQRLNVRRVIETHGHWDHIQAVPAVRDAGIDGVVPLGAVIGVDGRVVSVRGISASAHPALTQAAIDAVRQWEFTPTLLNGQPVEVFMTVTVKFSLED